MYMYIKRANISGTVRKKPDCVCYYYQSNKKSGFSTVLLKDYICENVTVTLIFFMCDYLSQKKENLIYSPHIHGGLSFAPGSLKTFLFCAIRTKKICRSYAKWERLIIPWLSVLSVECFVRRIFCHGMCCRRMCCRRMCCRRTFALQDVLSVGCSVLQEVLTEILSYGMS